MTMRPLRWRDWHFCWELAHDPDVRRWSLDPRLPTLLGHLRWMWRGTHGGAWAITDTRVGSNAIVVVGVLRRAPCRDGWDISIAVAARYRVLGYGKAALRWATHEWRAVPLYARIKHANTASRMAFTMTGFVLIPGGDTTTGLYQWTPSNER